MIYDVIIIGGGPCGLTASVYAMRAQLNALLIEQMSINGGQILSTYEVDNYPGLPLISGVELGEKMSAHATRLGIERVEATVQALDIASDIKRVITSQGEYSAKTIVMATGASPRKLGVPGEEDLIGCGVSYCATCDGAFFKNHTVAVVGGGDVAVEDAIFLARGCKKVYLIHRRDELRAAKTLQTALLALDNVEVIWDSVVDSIVGDGEVEGLKIHNVKTEESSELEVAGVFVATGNAPNSSYINEDNSELIKCDERGFIMAGEDCATNVPGVYAGGDVRTKKLRQVVTAVADGANAINSILDYLNN